MEAFSSRLKYIARYLIRQYFLLYYLSDCVLICLCLLLIIVFLVYDILTKINHACLLIIAFLNRNVQFKLFFVKSHPFKLVHRCTLEYRITVLEAFMPLLSHPLIQCITTIHRPVLGVLRLS